MQDPKSVIRLKEGDIATLKRLFKSNHNGLFALVFRLTRDRDAADEVIRAAFRRLWADRKELDPMEVIFRRLAGYCYTFAMEYRSDNDVTGIESAARTSDGEAVAAQLDKLPQEERLTYLLHIVDGYSVRQLAGAFGTSEDSVREIVGSALVKLDDAFEQEVQKTSGDT